MWFDQQGEVVDWDGDPILLDYSIEEGKLQWTILNESARLKGFLGVLAMGRFVVTEKG